LKSEFLNKCAAIVCKKLDLLPEDIEVMDLSTPATFHRYTGNWKGSTQGWLAGKNLLAPSPVKLRVPGLDNMFLCSHWNQPGGGLPIAIKTGRDLAMLLCKENGVRFK
jgi:phytoene dehydrogenase-like protein